MDIDKLLCEHGEIQFSYNNCYYMISCYNVRKILRKSRVEYWFFPPDNSSQEAQKFDSLDKLLDVEIDGHKLRDILDGIVIEIE